MPTYHAAVAAIPTVGAVDKGGLRSVLVSRNYYPLSPSENSTDLVAVDPDGGGTVPGLIQNGLLYALDDADTTTANDGVTCLVSNDGKRYKLESGLHAPFYVLDKDLTAPPVSPTIGDAYLIYGSPTGAWSGHSGAVALYTARGWSFATVPVGFLLYVSDETAYYHRDIGGTWTLGTGSRTLGSHSVTLDNLINVGKYIRVENQTTNTPPVSPTKGDAYIVGSSPTGVWVGNSLKVAICEDGSTFTIYTPANGWSAYDKSLNAGYTFNGSAWITSAGAWAFFTSQFTQGTGSTTQANSSDYTYSNSTAPTTSARLTRDDVSITRAASRVGATQRFRYQANFSTGNASTIALFVDGGTNAVAWTKMPTLAAGSNVEFILTSGDTSPHVYKIAIIESSGHVGAIDRRQFTYEESP